MSFELSSLMQARQGENFRLHSEYLNPQLVRVLKTLGFDRFYVKGEGCYLYDQNGDRYLDFLAGFGVYALGRGHPVVKKALHDALDMDLPNLVQLDAALLPGLLAEALVARTHDGIQRCFFSNSAPRPSRRRSSSRGTRPSGPGSSTPITPSTASASERCPSTAARSSGKASAPFFPAAKRCPSARSSRSNGSSSVMTSRHWSSKSSKEKA